MKILHLTAASRQLTESAKTRLKEWEDRGYEEPRCKGGHTREYYENMAMRVPEEIIEQEKILDSDFETEAEDYELTPMDCNIRLDAWHMTIEREEGSTIWLKDGTFVNVVEEAWQVDAEIEWLSRPFYQRIKDFIYNNNK